MDTKHSDLMISLGFVEGHLSLSTLRSVRTSPRPGDREHPRSRDPHKGKDSIGEWLILLGVSVFSCCEFR